MTAFLLYKTDQWNTNSTKELVAVSENVDTLISVLRGYFLEQNANSAYPLDKGIEIAEHDMLSELESQWQTQGYSTNYTIQEVESNKLLLS